MTCLSHLELALAVLGPFLFGVAAGISATLLAGWRDI
jgi:hypothetical protein